MTIRSSYSERSVPAGQGSQYSPNLSVEQTAIALGLSKSWLNKKRVTGGGPAFLKLGRRVVYDSADVAAWAAAHRRNNTSEY